LSANRALHFQTRQRPAKHFRQRCRRHSVKPCSLERIIALSAAALMRGLPRRRDKLRKRAVVCSRSRRLAAASIVNASNASASSLSSESSPFWLSNTKQVASAMRLLPTTNGSFLQKSDKYAAAIANTPQLVTVEKCVLLTSSSSSRRALRLSSLLTSCRAFSGARAIKPANKLRQLGTRAAPQAKALQRPSIP
jgi:hypothetical protein